MVLRGVETRGREEWRGGGRRRREVTRKEGEVETEKGEVEREKGEVERGREDE